MIYLFAFGASVIAALAGYAGYLLVKLSKQKQVSDARLKARVDDFTKSIQTIALAVSQQQCDISEACIRLAVLLDTIPILDKPDYAALYPNLHTVYDQVKHMATHEERKQQPKHITQEDDALRAALEEKYSVEIIKEAQRLRHFNAS